MSRSVNNSLAKKWGGGGLICERIQMSALSIISSNLWCFFPQLLYLSQFLCLISKQSERKPFNSILKHSSQCGATIVGGFNQINSPCIKAIKLSVGTLLHHMSASKMKEEWPIFETPSCGWIESAIFASAAPVRLVCDCTTCLCILWKPLVVI